MRPRPPVRATLPSLVLESRLPRIPPAAVLRLAALAEQQSEGRFDRGASTRTYYGSTYFTFPLARVRAAFAGRTVREMGAAGLAHTLEAHPLLRLRLVRLARQEAERRIACDRPAEGSSRTAPGDEGLAPGTARVTSVVSPEGDAVVIEVGIELPCVPCRGRGVGRGERARGAGGG